MLNEAVLAGFCHSVLASFWVSLTLYGLSVGSSGTWAGGANHGARGGGAGHQNRVELVLKMGVLAVGAGGGCWGRCGEQAL